MWKLNKLTPLAPANAVVKAEPATVYEILTDYDNYLDWFPLTNPGIISIPFGFFCGWLGTMVSTEKNTAKYAELEVRSLTGVGAAN